MSTTKPPVAYQSLVWPELRMKTTREVLRTSAAVIFAIVEAASEVFVKWYSRSESFLEERTRHMLMRLTSTAGRAERPLL